MLTPVREPMSVYVGVGENCAFYVFMFTCVRACVCVCTCVGWRSTSGVVPQDQSPLFLFIYFECVHVCTRAHDVCRWVHIPCNSRDAQRTTLALCEFQCLDSGHWLWKQVPLSIIKASVLLLCRDIMTMQHLKRESV